MYERIDGKVYGLRKEWDLLTVADGGFDVCKAESLMKVHGVDVVKYDDGQRVFVYEYSDDDHKARLVDVYPLAELV